MITIIVQLASELHATLCKAAIKIILALLLKGTRKARTHTQKCGKIACAHPRPHIIDFLRFGHTK